MALNLTTTPYDPRFPNTNKNKMCWVNYVDFFRCVAKEGGDEEAEACQQFKKNYFSLCPGFWLESWDQQRADGVFPADLGDGVNTGKN